MNAAEKNAPERALKTFEYWVGGSIAACRLNMIDGSRSDKLGKFHPLDKKASLIPYQQVKYIVMRGDSEYCQSIQMYDKDMKPFFTIDGTFTEGETRTFELEKGEQIIGVHGIYNH